MRVAELDLSPTALWTSSGLADTWGSPICRMSLSSRLRNRRMPRKHCILILAVVVLVASGMASALAAIKPKPVSVEVPRHPRIVGDFTIGFRSREPLPNGGYYYAVVVLTKYYAKHPSSVRCAQASNMDYTEYGYPGPGRPVYLRLSPEKSALTTGEPLPLDWCSGATYQGAVYAVPHGLPCRRSEPCYGHSTAPECYAGEALCSGGKQLHGKVRNRRRHAGELPEPRDSSTRIIAHFRVPFRRK